MVILIWLLTVYFSLFTLHCYAEEPPAVITSDSLEYDGKTSIYTAIGSVKVEQGNATINSKKMRYNEKTATVFAEGDVVYDTSDISLKAETAEYNLDTKQGIFYNSEIFSKTDNLHISGTKIEKQGEKKYFFDKASLTTCDAVLPAWCFKGRNADLIIGDRLKAKDVTFNVRGLPVMYTPYIWAPILTERKTGFLTPTIGYSKTKDFYFRQPFFWAISENRDATFVLDWYSKIGIGKGLEYRYIYPGDIEGTHWLYNLNDRTTGKKIYEWRSYHVKRSSDGISAYINLNYLNEKRFYRDYSIFRHERIKRFLESTGEISLPMDDSHFYIMSRYLIDLKDGSNDSAVVQRLPEAGYVFNPYKIGPVIFSLTSSASNLWRKEGVYGQRLDINPRLSHFFGDSIVISQYLGLRETAYSLHKNELEGFKKSVQRETFDYNITASSRIIKRYENFTHAIEPSLGYTFIPWIKKDKINLPLFDSTENYSKQASGNLSITNRILDSLGEFFTLSLSQSYNGYERIRPFSPLSIAASIGRPLQLRGDIAYNSYSGRIENINSDMSMSLQRVSLNLGERYDRVQNRMFYNIDIQYTHPKNLSTALKLWYDAKGGGLRDTTLTIGYQKQCWGVTFIINRKPADEINKKPSDLTVFMTINLLGLGSLSGGK
ncbi:MAG: LPS-assembly protein LptD [Nitrospirae bacterium]|nr:LPS-assembly protein LptD [Nitrospirota bacterium]